MLVGIPREIKNNEYRVAVVPSGVRVFLEHGHQVFVEKEAGAGAGIKDEEYEAAGARIVATSEAIFNTAEMILKVKEPLAQEYKLLREGHILFTYLHLASSTALTKAMLEKKIIGIAYETVQLENNSLPLLTPMSEIAGKLSVQVGAHYLEKENGGSGILLSGAPGVNPASVCILGGGTVGSNAAKIAVGMGARVTILDINLDKLRHLDNALGGRITFLTSNPDNIENSVVDADLVIGGVLIPGAKSKKLVTRNMITRMRKGSVMVDVAIDQGGCFETSIATTFDHPVFLYEGIIQYCVANMPSCVSRTSTFSLTNATLPYALKIADLGYKKAFAQSLPLRKGLNVYLGKLTNKAVSDAVGIEYSAYDSIF